MSVYFLPPLADPKDVMEIATRAGIPFIQPATIREFIIETHAKPIVFASVGAEILLVLNRHARQLMDELPSVVMSVPNGVYTGDWMTVAATFPPMDWIEIKRKAEKSGLLATTPEQMETRSRGSIANRLPSENGIEILRGRHRQDPDDAGFDDEPDAGDVG